MNTNTNTKIDIDYLKKNDLIIFETISGSRAYGLENENSDTDIRGVFILPEEEYFGFDYVDQVNNETNDIVYYELKKFFSLMEKSNPNILELLGSPEDCISIISPVFRRIPPDKVLSRACRDSFGRYAMTQVKKARGLNKKIVNPMSEEKKGLLDFCYVVQEYSSIPLGKWLLDQGLDQKNCGLAKLPHFQDVYALFYADSRNSQEYKGVVGDESYTEVRVSSIPKGETLKAYMSFNKDGYRAYCKKYKEYQGWLKTRNNERYQGNIEHGKNYDSKNLMHTFRLLNMAAEIAKGQGILVRRPDRKKLLEIKSGVFEYEQLLRMSEERMEKIEELYESSNLPQTPNREYLKSLMVEIRQEFYKERRLSPPP